MFGASAIHRSSDGRCGAYRLKARGSAFDFESLLQVEPAEEEGSSDLGDMAGTMAVVVNGGVGVRAMRNRQSVAMCVCLPASIAR